MKYSGERGNVEQKKKLMLTEHSPLHVDVHGLGDEEVRERGCFDKCVNILIGLGELQLPDVEMSSANHSIQIETHDVGMSIPFQVSQDHLSSILV